MELPRLAPCRILLQDSIPTSLWFENAIDRYGVPTVVFDFHLLVPDIEQTSAILRQQRWAPKPPSVYFRPRYLSGDKIDLATFELASTLWCI